MQFSYAWKKAPRSPKRPSNKWQIHVHSFWWELIELQSEVCLSVMQTVWEKLGPREKKPHFGCVFKAFPWNGVVTHYKKYANCLEEGLQKWNVRSRSYNRRRNSRLLRNYFRMMDFWGATQLMQCRWIRSTSRKLGVHTFLRPDNRSCSRHAIALHPDWLSFKSGANKTWLQTIWPVYHEVALS
jgi:hypothetical protein